MGKTREFLEARVNQSILLFHYRRCTTFRQISIETWWFPGTAGTFRTDPEISNTSSYFGVRTMQDNIYLGNTLYFTQFLSRAIIGEPRGYIFASGNIESSISPIIIVAGDKRYL
jgi:hypothetical protein